MRYKVGLTASERELLAVLIGQQLAFVRADGWSAVLQAGDIGLDVVPEEVPTPDTEHPVGDVERPLVRLVQEPDLMRHGQRIVESAGLVRAVNIISVLVSFSPVVECPPTELRPGVVLPTSNGYGWIYHPPALLADAETEAERDSALVELDIAFELVTELHPSVVFYTRGYFVCVSANGLPEDEDWADVGYFVRQSLRPVDPA
jgi:hypothetical protein